jgi:hypothetical protein
MLAVQILDTTTILHWQWRNLKAQVSVVFLFVVLLSHKVVPPAQLDQGGSLQTMKVESIAADKSAYEWFTQGIMEQANLSPQAGVTIGGSNTNEKDRWWRARHTKFLRNPVWINDAGRNIFYLGGHEYTGNVCCVVLCCMCVVLCLRHCLLLLSYCN